MAVYTLMAVCTLMAVTTPAIAEESAGGRLQQMAQDAGSEFDLRFIRPVIAGSRASGQLVFSAGTTMLPGASIMIGRHWLDPARLQTDDPNQNNYIALQSSSDGKSWIPSYEGVKGLYGGLESQAESVIFTLAQGTLAPGETVTFSLEDIEIPRISRQRYSFGVFTRRSAEAPWQFVSGNALAINAGDMAALNLSADSLAEPGKELDVFIRMEDAFGNLVSDRNLSLDLLVNGVFRQRVNVEAALQSIPGVRFDIPGDYLLEVRSGGGGLRASSNPIRVGQAADQIIWADIGSTTTKSDGIWSESELRQNRAGIYDLVIPADHPDYLQAEDESRTGMVSIKPQWPGTESHFGYATLSLQGSPDIRLLNAEKPVDIRWLTPSVASLAEVVSRNSMYRWLGNLVAEAGYPSGVFGSNHSHQYPQSANLVYTAIVPQSRQHFYQALLDAQTYVSVGEKIILSGLPKQLMAGTYPEMTITAIASSDVRHMLLYRNGELIRRTLPPKPEPSGFTLGLYSSSEPWSRINARPRNAREWVGFISARGADISTTNVSGWEVRQGTDQSRLDFYTRTHGKTAYLDFQLSDMTPDTVVELTIAPGFEDAAWIPGDRLPSETAPARFLMAMNEITTGVVRRMETNGYTDTMTLNLHAESDARIAEFQYKDTREARVGDYYQLIIELSNGHYAISSPIYVGDF